MERLYIVDVDRDVRFRLAELIDGTWQVCENTIGPDPVYLLGDRLNTWLEFHGSSDLSITRVMELD